MSNKYSFILLVVFLNIGLMKAQSLSDFYKTNYELNDIDDGGSKVEKKNFFLVNQGANSLNKSFIDNCQNYLENNVGVNGGEYLNEYYFFYRETNALNRNSSFSLDKLLENHFNDIIVILRYTKTSNGVDKLFSTLNNGQIVDLYINDVKKYKN